MCSGMTIVSFLRGLSWAKLDNDKHKLLLKTVQNNYPARANRVAVMSLGWMTKAALRILRPFMKNKRSFKVGASATMLTEHVVAVFAYRLSACC